MPFFVDSRVVFFSMLTADDPNYRAFVGQGRRKFPEKKRFDFFSIIL